MRRELGDEVRSAMDEQILNRLRTLDAFITARTIASYRAIDGEVNPEALQQDCRRLGKDICYPKVVNETEMNFVAPKQWQRNRFGHQPIGETVDIQSIDLIIVPGVAFSSKGCRLGFGAGYYDRALASYNGYTVGLAYPFQLRENLIAEAWDVPVHMVIHP